MIVGLQLLLHVGIGYHNITGLLMELTQPVTLADSLGDVGFPLPTLTCARSCRAWYLP